MPEIDHQQSSCKLPATRSSVIPKAPFLNLTYLLAIGLATLGWLWLIAWGAIELLS
jgi:hypothetical protein